MNWYSHNFGGRLIPSKYFLAVSLSTKGLAGKSVPSFDDLCMVIGMYDFTIYTPMAAFPYFEGWNIPPDVLEA